MSKKNPESTSPDKEQYKIRIEKQLIERLSHLGARCGYSSGNEFAAEALQQYAELLADLIEEQHALAEQNRRRQHQEVLERTRAFRK